MKHLRLPATALVLGLAVLSVCPCPQTAQRCAEAFPQNKPVEIADESAIIIWDATTKTQHFIRRASFKTYGQDFGFLVPTPTKPTLAEAGDETFAKLTEITAPRVVTQSAPSGGGGCIGCGMAAPKGASPGIATAESAVRVLDEQRVAGYDTATLEADDADSLAKWLEEHSYDISPRLKEWVRPYVNMHWKITAFKFAKKNADEPEVNSAAVRMTFHTERPIFPYREPASEAPKSEKPLKERLLRVFFLSDKRMQGTLGDKGPTWPGKTVWAKPLTAEQRDLLLKQLKLAADTPPPSWWLTEFEDHSSPRPGTDDVYFASSDDQTLVERPPFIQYVSRKMPDGVMCYALAAYMIVPCLIRCVRRKK